jgi:hypothetical protein
LHGVGFGLRGKVGGNDRDGEAKRQSKRTEKLFTQKVKQLDAIRGKPSLRKGQQRPKGGGMKLEGLKR